jgi:hypothetical protein
MLETALAITFFSFIWHMVGMIEDGYNGRANGADWLWGHRLDWIRRDGPLIGLYLIFVIPFYIQTIEWWTIPWLGVIFYAHEIGGQAVYEWAEDQRGNDKGKPSTLIWRANWAVIGLIWTAIIFLVKQVM